MKVLVLVGSMRSVSTTRHALVVAADAAREAGADVRVLDLKDLGLPLCDGRADEASYGPEVEALKQAVMESNAILIGSPEYYGSMPGALKNAIDLAGEDVFKGKMVGLCAVGRGEAGAMNTLNHLRQVFRWMGAWVLPTQVSVPRAQDAFDPEGHPIRPGLDRELMVLGQEVVRYSHLLAGNGRA